MKKTTKKPMRKRVLSEVRKNEDYATKQLNINMQKRAGIITEARAKQLLSEAWEDMMKEEEDLDVDVDVEEGPEGLEGGEGPEGLEGGEEDLDVDVDVEEPMGLEGGEEVDLSNPEELAARLADRIADVIEDTLRVSIDVESDGVPLEDDDFGDDDDLPAPDMDDMGDDDMGDLGDEGGMDDMGDEDEDELLELKDKGPKGKKPGKMKYSTPDQKFKAAPKAKNMTMKEQLAKKVANEIAKTLLEAKAQKARKTAKPLKKK